MKALLLAAVVALLPAYSFAQTPTAITQTAEANIGLGQGVINTNDIVMVNDFSIFPSLQVAVGSTTNCDRGMNPNIAEAMRSANVAALNMMIFLDGRLETGTRIARPSGFFNTPIGLTLVCMHKHSASAFQAGLMDMFSSIKISGTGVEIGFQKPDGSFVPRDVRVLPFSLERKEPGPPTVQPNGDVRCGTGSIANPSTVMQFLPMSTVPHSTPAEVQANAGTFCPMLDQLSTLILFFANLPCGSIFGCTPFGSPIIVDFGTPGLALTGLDKPVQFDLDGDGKKTTMGWTAAGAADAFLAIDRNGNGIIDNGLELFGNTSKLADGSTAIQGYQALAQLDLPSQGGNANGIVDQGDRDFAKLRFWTDSNHNGISERSELVSATSKNIFGFRLDPQNTVTLDPASGNALAFSAPLAQVVNGALVSIPTTDVFFRTGP